MTKPELMEAKLKTRKAKQAERLKLRKGTVRVKTSKLLSKVQLTGIQSIESVP